MVLRLGASVPDELSEMAKNIFEHRTQSKGALM